MKSTPTKSPTRNVLKTAAALSLCAILGLACAERTVANAADPAQPSFVSADVSISRNPAGQREKRSIHVTGENVTRLLKFFPQVGEGATSSFAGGWIPAAKITFHRDDGATASASISAHYDAWSEGRGDWPLAPEFAKFLTELMKNPATHASTRATSKPGVDWGDETGHS